MPRRRDCSSAHTWRGKKPVPSPTVSSIAKCSSSPILPFTRPLPAASRRQAHFFCGHLVGRRHGRQSWASASRGPEPMRRSRRYVVLASLAAFAAPAFAQEDASYPGRAIHIVVPFPAGGPSDLVSRVIAQRMSEDWKVPVVIDNRPGGNTIIGAQVVARAAPDGYTLLMAIDSTLVMNQFLYKSLPYDPFTDFVPITQTTQTV